jgi:hypothetical protein
MFLLQDVHQYLLEQCHPRDPGSIHVTDDWHSLLLRSYRVASKNPSNLLFLEKENKYSSKFFAVASGRSWSYFLDSPSEINYKEIYIQACSNTPVYLDSLLNDNKHQFLDEHPGIDVAQYYPEVEAHIQKLISLAPDPHVGGIDLKTGKMSDKIGGSTFHAIHQCLSSCLLLLYYTVDQDDASCAYMVKK